MNQNWAWYCKRYCCDTPDGEGYDKEHEYPVRFFIGTEEEVDDWIEFQENAFGASYGGVSKRPLTKEEWDLLIYCSY